MDERGRLRSVRNRAPNSDTAVSGAQSVLLSNGDRGELAIQRSCGDVRVAQSPMGRRQMRVAP